MSPDRSAGATERRGRIPIYSIWHRETGALLSLGMLTAAARAHRDGALLEAFDIRPPETGDTFLADLATHDGPAVLLSSDYVWSIRANLELAKAGLASNPDLVVIHGGPSCPKYPADAAAFLRNHADVAHILVRGEGEATLCEVLDELARTDGKLDPAGMARVEGLTFLGSDGEPVRTPDRDRLSELDSLPSPYLGGEFDHLDGEAWSLGLSVETTRGCPYGCTFCDWGSATLSRIRKFDLDRVEAEFAWAVDRGVRAIQITDANFGIMKRDVETARRIAAVAERSGRALTVMFTPAKNTTKHLCNILDVLAGSGVSVSTGLSLQTTDEGTLDAIDRSNISTDHYVALAAEFRRRGHPLQGDLMLGLPGQSFDSYRLDLQFFLDHEIMARTWPVQLLPNAPMNDPAYKELHGIVTDHDNLVVATNTFDVHDRRRMSRLRTVDSILERLGVLRHVMRYLQWDHGTAATEVMARILEITDNEPQRFPLITWLTTFFDRFPVAPTGWKAFYAEVRQLLEEEYPACVGPELDTVLTVQEALMPAPGRAFPVTVTLTHDYEAYYRSATKELVGTGHAGVPSSRLAEHGPAAFTVAGDPLDLCTVGLQHEEDTQSEVIQADFHVGSALANELESPLIRILPAMSGRAWAARGPEIIARHMERLGLSSGPGVEPVLVDDDDHDDATARDDAGEIIVPMPVTVGSSARSGT